MRKIREVLRLSLGEGLSPRQVRIAVGLPRTTVQRYLERAARQGLSWPGRLRRACQGALRRHGRARNGSSEAESRIRRCPDVSSKPACACLAAEPKQSPTSSWLCPSSKSLEVLAGLDGPLARCDGRQP